MAVTTWYTRAVTSPSLPPRKHHSDIKHRTVTGKIIVPTHIISLILGHFRCKLLEAPDAVAALCEFVTQVNSRQILVRDRGHVRLHPGAVPGLSGLTDDLEGAVVRVVLHVEAEEVRRDVVVLAVGGRTACPTLAAVEAVLLR